MGFDARLYKKVTARNPVIKPLPILHTTRTMWEDVERTVRGRIWKWFRTWMPGKNTGKLPIVYQKASRSVSRVPRAYRVRQARRGW